MKKSKNTLKQMKMERQLFQNLWDAVKAVLEGMLIVMQAYLKRQEQSQINNLTLHLKEPGKDE